MTPGAREQPVPASPQASQDALLELLDRYDFELPEANIAQAPAEVREAARLLVVGRESGRLGSANPGQRIADLPTWLRPGDLLVRNATRVLPARLVGRKQTGGSAEALLLGSEPSLPGAFRALVKCTGHLRVGLTFWFAPPAAVENHGASAAASMPSPTSAAVSMHGVSACISALHGRGEVTLEFAPGADPYSVGVAPLPPYIRRAASAPSARDLERYQTVYAREPGAIAAPTAGLHFTHALFERLQSRGVELAEVVLHVGAGTFRPLDAQALATGKLHREVFDLPQATVDAVARTRARGGRVVAVGTTTTRVLESCVDDSGRLQAGAGETDLFLQPGGPPFRVIDGLLTNFHLPRSSLLLLVAALIGREPLLEAYRYAIEQGFRFYSYGDAMLILPEDDVTHADLHGGPDAR